MTNVEVMNLVENVIKIHWPSFSISKELLDTWMKFLRPFDYKSAEQAVKQHYASAQGIYKNPKLYAIIEKAKFYQPKKAIAKKEKNDYEPDVFVQCIEHENDIKLFQFYPIYVRTDKQNDHDYILRAAENTRQKVESCYSGTWITVQQTTHSEMRDVLLKHRAKTNQKSNIKN